jgi:hypothetical protein
MPRDYINRTFSAASELKYQEIWLAWKELHFNDIEQKFISTQISKGWTYTHPISHLLFATRSTESSFDWKINS